MTAPSRSKIVRMDAVSFGMMMADAGRAILVSDRLCVDAKRAASEFVRWWVGLDVHRPAWLVFDEFDWKKNPPGIYE